MGRRQRRRNRRAAGQPALSTTVVRVESADVSAVATDEPTRRLTELVDQRRQLDVAIDHEINRLVDTGTSWPVIAAALGVTRQAVRQRHERRRTTLGQPTG